SSPGPVSTRPYTGHQTAPTQARGSSPQARRYAAVQGPLPAPKVHCWPPRRMSPVLLVQPARRCPPRRPRPACPQPPLPGPSVRASIDHASARLLDILSRLLIGPVVHIKCLGQLFGHLAVVPVRLFNVRGAEFERLHSNRLEVHTRRVIGRRFRVHEFLGSLGLRPHPVGDPLGGLHHRLRLLGVQLEPSANEAKTGPDAGCALHPAVAGRYALLALDRKRQVLEEATFLSHGTDLPDQSRTALAPEPNVTVRRPSAGKNGKLASTLTTVAPVYDVPLSRRGSATAVDVTR